MVRDDLYIGLDSERIVNRGRPVAIFDFDGVILNSVHLKGEAFVQMYQKYGVKFAERVKKFHLAHGGVSRFEKFMEWSKWLSLSLDDKDLEALNVEYSGRILDDILAVPYITGVEEYLAELSNSGVIMAINSATPSEELIKIVRKRNIDHYFNLILGSSNSKIDNNKIILKTLCCKGTDTVFYGDALSDFKAAIAGGIEFVGVGKDIYPHLNLLKEHYFWIENFKVSKS